MDRKGQDTFTLIRNIALAVVVLLLIIYVLYFQFGVFRSAVNACEERGGKCVPQNSCLTEVYGEDTRILYEGKGACKKVEVCCTSTSIKQRLEENVLLPGSNDIRVNVNTRSSLYRNEQNIPLYVGEENDFKVDVEEDLGSYCTIAVITSEGNALPAFTNEGNCNDFELTGVRFDMSDEGRDLRLKISTYEDSSMEEVKANAFFPLGIDSPLEVDMTSGWDTEHRVTLRCAYTGCENASAILVAESEDCYDGVGNPLKLTETRFVNNRLTVFFNNESIMASGISTPVNGYVCFNVGLDADIEIKTLSSNRLMLDFEAPRVNFNRETLEISCMGDGAPCKTYHSKIYPSTSISQILNTNPIQLLAGALIDSMLINQSREIGRCPALESNEYRRSDSSTLDLRGSLAGAACIYAEDEAGNPSRRELVIYKDEEGMKQILRQKLGDELKDQINSLFE